MFLILQIKNGLSSLSLLSLSFNNRHRELQILLSHINVPKRHPLWKRTKELRRQNKLPEVSHLPSVTGSSIVGTESPQMKTLWIGLPVGIPIYQAWWIPCPVVIQPVSNRDKDWSPNPWGEHLKIWLKIGYLELLLT